MAASNPYQVYQQTQIKTVSQGKLILMLYEGALGFLNQALKVMSEKNFEEINYYLLRTQNIMDELTNTLNLTAGGEVARHLYTFYQTINKLLVEANIKTDPLLVKRAIKMLEEMQEAWQIIICGPSSADEEGKFSA